MNTLFVYIYVDEESYNLNTLFNKHNLLICAGGGSGITNLEYKVYRNLHAKVVSLACITTEFGAFIQTNGRTDIYEHIIEPATPPSAYYI